MFANREPRTANRDPRDGAAWLPRRKPDPGGGVPAPYSVPTSSTWRPGASLSVVRASRQGRLRAGRGASAERVRPRPRFRRREGPVPGRFNVQYGKVARAGV